MQEAKYSLNMRYNFNGYDSQITLRSDDNCQELLDKQLRIAEILGKLGATPERRWENVKNGNGKPAPAPNNGKPTPKDDKPRCVKCGSDNLELITWTKDGEQRKAFKCQDCQAWQPSPK
jgi:hypothetical protein